MSPDLVERTRMALAEVGYGPEATYSVAGVLHYDINLVPEEVAWRAASIAGAERHCLACNSVAQDLGLDAWDDFVAACLADRPLVRDCGVSR